MGSIFYLIGKSAAGKDRIYARLLERDDLRLSELPLATTRPIRSGEIEGKQYHFKTVEEFDELLKDGRLIEKRTYETVAGPWHYGTLAEGIELDDADYLGIGTLESFLQIRDYFGADRVHAIFIDVTDENLLLRAMRRESKQETPNYRELCRRFLADAGDLSDDKLTAAGIMQRFDNNGDLDDCIEAIAAYIRGICDVA